MKKYILKNLETQELIELSLIDILKDINRDRSQYWVSYDEKDWIEGLNEFTEFKLIGEKYERN